MYKILFIAVSVLFITWSTAQAQTDQGNFLLKGDLSPFWRGNTTRVYNLSDSTNIITRHKLSGIETTIGLGYFFKKNIALGLNTHLGNRRLRQEVNNFEFLTKIPSPANYSILNSSLICTIGSFLRIYPIDLDKLKIFTDFSIGLGFASAKQVFKGVNIPGQRKSFRFTNYMLAIGADYFVSDKIAIEVGISYNNYDLPVSANFLEGIYSQNITGSLGVALILNRSKE